MPKRRFALQMNLGRQWSARQWRLIEGEGRNEPFEDSHVVLDVKAENRYEAVQIAKADALLLARRLLNWVCAADPEIVETLHGSHPMWIWEESEPEPVVPAGIASPELSAALHARDAERSE